MARGPILGLPANRPRSVPRRPIEATSLLVNCESQEEVDRPWERLGEGGQPGPCGWLKDRFGLSWQIVPVALTEVDPDQVRAQRVMAAMLQMGKIDVAELRRARDSGWTTAAGTVGTGEPHGPE